MGYVRCKKLLYNHLYGRCCFLFVFKYNYDLNSLVISSVLQIVVYEEYINIDSLLDNQM